MCITIPHKDDSAAVSQAPFLCRRAENGFVLRGFLLQLFALDVEVHYESVHSDAL